MVSDEFQQMVGCALTVGIGNEESGLGVYLGVEERLKGSFVIGSKSPRATPRAMSISTSLLPKPVRDVSNLEARGGKQTLQ